MSQTKAQLIDTLVASLLPASDSAVDIGSNAVRFANIYGDTLYGSGANLTGLNIVTDTSPQLGGDLDVNGKKIKFPDLTGSVNNILYFGTGDDLLIYHFADINVIQCENARTLRLQHFSGGNETLANFIPNGAVELYYDNSKKLETTATGVTASGDVSIGNDTSKFLSGAGNDLQLYHDGGNSVIDNLTGGLFIKGTGSSGIQFQNRNGNESMARFFPDGAVELYHNNVKMLETTSIGASCAGSITAVGAFLNGDVQFTGDNYNVYWDKSENTLEFKDNAILAFGDSDDFTIKHVSSDSTTRLIETSGGSFFIQAGNFIVTNPAGNENMINAAPDGAVEIYYDNVLRVKGHSFGTFLSSDANLGRLILGDTSGNFGYQIAGYDANSAGAGGRLVLQDADGAVVLDSRASGGNMFIYNTIKLNGNATADNLKLIFGAGEDLQIFHNGTNSFISNTTGNIQIDSDAEVQVNATAFKVKNAADTETMASFQQDGKVTLYYNNAQAARTEANGFAVLGEEGSDANLFFFADEADDVADQWRIQALASDSKLEFRNRDDGNYRINAEMVGSGHVKLYNDNSQRFATYAGGAIVYGQWRQAETNGNTRTMKTVVTNGLASGETLSFQDTSLNFHGFGEVTVILRHNSTSQQATMKKFPISIRSTANAGLGSEIFSINAATAGQSMTVVGTDRGVNVTNNESHGCTCTVILDLIIFA